MFKGKSISVAMPAYNEAQSIAPLVRSFLAVPEIDEVVVVDNNCTDGTGVTATRAGARVVIERKQGYGYACQTALRTVESDYVFIVESDETFRATDIYKFLAYADEFDVIFGTRTSKSCIWDGANMGHFLRYGNWAVAKWLEYLHNGPCLTDVGCTYKFFRRDALKRILPHLTIGGNSLSPQIMLVAIRLGLRCVEIPVNYGSRVGTSKITGSFRRALLLGLKMILLITTYRFKRLPDGPSRTPSPFPQEECLDEGKAARAAAD